MVPIEEWSIVRGGDDNTAPELRPMLLRGKVYGHPSRHDGSHIISSEVVKLSLSERICRTRNTTYRLGRPHPDYAKRYKHCFREGS
jgi:hypothetical protein